jgi:hypothetical protein
MKRPVARPAFLFSRPVRRYALAGLKVIATPFMQ